MRTFNNEQEARCQKLYDDLIALGDEHEDPEDYMLAIIGYINKHYVKREV